MLLFRMSGQRARYQRFHNQRMRYNWMFQETKQFAEFRKSIGRRQSHCKR